MFVNKKVLRLIVCIAAIFFAIFTMQSVRVGAQGDVSKDKQLEALLTQRRDLLKQRLDMFGVLEGSAQSSFESTIDARDDYLDAEIELSSDKNTRVAFLEQKLENAKKREALMSTLVRAGQRLKTDALHAATRRLDVEIELLREKK